MVSTKNTLSPPPVFSEGVNVFHLDLFERKKQYSCFSNAGSVDCVIFCPQEEVRIIYFKSIQWIPINTFVERFPSEGGQPPPQNCTR